MHNERTTNPALYQLGYLPQKLLNTWKDTEQSEDFAEILYINTWITNKETVLDTPGHSLSEGMTTLSRGKSKQILEAASWKMLKVQLFREHTIQQKYLR